MMKMMRRSRTTLFLASLLLAVSASTVFVRNGFFEFCTTSAYGFPFPWKIDYCPCGRESPPYSPWYWSLNIGIALAFGFIISKMLHCHKRGTGESLT